MIDIATARRLLDFGARIGPGQRAEEQLEGAVVIHNILYTHKVAYLADEVGMGKTYVALGALALFRHFKPDFRVLIIAPRENIQRKWVKEFQSFVANNFRYPDLRVKALDERPVRQLATCTNLLDLAHQSAVNPNRDFFARLTSFSLPVSGGAGETDSLSSGVPKRDMVSTESAERLRREVMKTLPWIDESVFSLRRRGQFKDNVARAICCALPRFDLVIVDEGHNLKHGFHEHASSRNRVLALSMGHPDGAADPGLFPGYASRAERVLFLSATPVEETYSHLWNQLNVFGRAGEFDTLQDAEASEDAKKACARTFLIRRVTALTVGGEEHTKNLYRREWRRGGVQVHDEPIRVEDPKRRLVVALVQKKVSELLGHERFNASFQIGMLASFESFLETTKVGRGDADTGNFDGDDQTDDELEREGIDVLDVNRLGAGYRKTFGSEMPHPKMDALVDGLASSWERGTKALVFVRRVASVRELKRKLDERYDTWLIGRLRREMPTSVHTRLDALFNQYLSSRAEAAGERSLKIVGSDTTAGADEDAGGRDTFFAWFFRGDGPDGVNSGARVQRRFTEGSSPYATFFADNYVADVLGCRPAEVTSRLESILGVSTDQLRDGIRSRASVYLSRARTIPRKDRFEAAQAAAIEWLKDFENPHQETARRVWHARFQSSKHLSHASAAPDLVKWLDLHTFFTELRERAELRAALWPAVFAPEPHAAFVERELRAQGLATAARLGHAFIDFYALAIGRLNSIDLRAQPAMGDDEADAETSLVDAYLDLLESQMHTPLRDRGWGAFDELAEIAEHFSLILDVNEPDARMKPLSEAALRFGRLLGQQQPVGGMAGQINQTLVKQFRMPGYPFVLVTTDLLQEGEDLHTFCSAVHHYGIAWTPSSMEQRIGRIDRVRSQTERRLLREGITAVAGSEMLQVHFPHLADTVEVLQVRRVLQRMNVFLRLMHEGLIIGGNGERMVNTNAAFLESAELVPQIATRLQTAFPIQRSLLRGEVKQVAVDDMYSKRIKKRFAKLVGARLSSLRIEWEPSVHAAVAMGTVHLPKRIQPFSLQLRSFSDRVMLHCISPIGLVRGAADQAQILAVLRDLPVRVGMIPTATADQYDLTVEDNVLLADDSSTDASRLEMLIARVVHRADQLEQRFLADQDAPLEQFMTDLSKEPSRGR